jgi:hypothetical protein
MTHVEKGAKNSYAPGRETPLSGDEWTAVARIDREPTFLSGLAASRPTRDAKSPAEAELRGGILLAS